MKIEFLTGIAVITPDPPSSRRLYVDTLGLPLTDESGSGYLHSERIPGARHFGIWPLSQAAQACFGEQRWPEEIPVPQASIEFDVADAQSVQEAADELAAAGYQLLHATREEPWGQTVARLLSPEGTIVGISYTPAMHE
jgi:catechol 2,3-dioxygenase-like lactoylglutathione lyase family enzyme